MLTNALHKNYHSVRQASIAIGISSSHLNKILNGDLGVSSTVAIKIAPYLGISAAEALRASGHESLIGLLAADTAAPKNVLTETKQEYLTPALEVMALFNQLDERDKHIALALMRTFAREAAR